LTARTPTTTKSPASVASGIISTAPENNRTTIAMIGPTMKLAMRDFAPSCCRSAVLDTDPPMGMPPKMPDAALPRP